MKKYAQKVIDSALKVLIAGILNSLNFEPMFAQILMNMEYEAADIGTCGVDGKRFLFDPDFLASRTMKDRAFIIAHEALHMALLHPFAMRDLLKNNPKVDLELVNIAMDYSVNQILKKSGWEIPSDCYYDKRFEGKDWLEIFRILEREKPKSDEGSRTSSDSNSSDNSGPSESASVQQTRSQDGHNSPGNQRDKSGEQSKQSPSDTISEPGDNSTGNQDNSPSKQSDNGSDKKFPSGCKNHPSGGVIPANDDPKAELETKQSIQQAIEISHLAGKLPGSQKVALDEIFEEVESPWEILQNHIQRETCGEKSYARVSRRSLYSDIILPHVESDFFINDGVIAFDISGSVSDTGIQYFWKHTANIMAEYTGNIHLLFCDTRIKEENVFEFECSDCPEKIPTFIGRGGTRFAPVFEWVEEQDIQPNFLLYFTDMEPSDWGAISEPDYPVIWMVWSTYFNEEQTPFGEYVNISKEKY